MKSSKLIDQENLDEALNKIREMLLLLSNLGKNTTNPGGAFTPPSPTEPTGPGLTFNPNQNKDRNYDMNNLAQIGTMLTLNTPGVDFNPNQNRDRNYTNNVINVNAGVVGDENIIVDAVQNALNEISRRGYTTTYAGAIAV